MSKKIWAMISLLVIMAMVLAACGGGAATEAPAAEEPAAEEPAVMAKSVGIVLPTKNEPRWLQDEARFKESLTEKGYKVEILFSEGDSAKEKQNVESLLTKGAQVIILTPQDGAAAAASADAVRAANAKMIAYDRLILGTNAVDYYVTFDSIAVGEQMGQFLADNAMGTGLPLFLYAGAASDNNAFLFFEGAWNKLQPKIADGTFVIKNSSEAVALQDKATLTRDEMAKIIGQITTNWDFNTAKTLAESNLTAASDADKGEVFILAPNDGTSRAIADAFAADTAVTKYWITGQDAEKASVQYIIDGKQSMTVLKDVRTLVDDAIAAAVAFLEGGTPEQTTTYNNGTFDVPAKPSEVITVTKDNVQAEIFDSGYWPVADFDTTNLTMAPAEEAPADTEKMTFIFGRGGDLVGLDLAIVTDGESTRVAGQILEFSYTFTPGTTNPVPNLAECTPNEAATEWTCTLKQGVKFHDGADFNADAVIFNFNRWKNTTDPLHFPEQVFEYYEAMWGGFDDASIITSVDKVDDNTVKFMLSAPLAPFLANLAMDFFAISSPTALQQAGQDYGTPSVGAVGTGPFVFKEWVEGDHITAVANDNYWGGRPELDEIIWRVIADDSARYLALKAGDIQGLEQATVEDFTDATNNPDLVTMKKPPLNTGYLAFNYKIKEFQDPKVREAVAHAINKQAMMENFYGTTGIVAKTLVPPSMWGYNDAIQDWEYNPDLSKQLLAEAGFPDGLSEVTIAEDVLDADGNALYKAGDKIPPKFYYLPISRFYFPSPKEVGEAMAADLAKAGFNVELATEGDWPTYLGARRNGTLVGLYQLGWGGDNGDPDNFLGYFFSGGTEPIKREGWYKNPAVAELLQKALVTPGQDVRDPMYKEAEQMLHDDIARVWLFHQETPFIFSSRVSGYQPQAVDADNYKDVIVAP